MGGRPSGHDLYEPHLLALPRVRGLNVSAGGAGLAELQAALAEGAWVVVDVFGPPWQGRLPTGTSGPYGALCASGTGGKPYHAVLLIGFEGDVFFVLDPFWASTGQPFEVSDDELLATLMGHALVVSLQND